MQTSSDKRQLLEIATGNPDKLREFQELLKDYKVVGRPLDVEEIQSLDPIKVAEDKAKRAYEMNDNKPILVEDTSFEIKGLHDLPGTYVKDFCEDIDIKKDLCEVWLKGKDRSVTARVVLAICDGKDTHTWKGEIFGEIPETPMGDKGFGWHDIFIPKGETRTLAQMDLPDQYKYTMRVIAVKEFLRNPFISNA